MMTSEDIERVKEDRGTNDLTRQIEDLQKQKTYLQSQCRKAGRAMIELNKKYDANLKEIDRLAEENNNLKTLLKDKSVYLKDDK